MNLSTTLKLMNGDIKATTAGAMGPADSRSADSWIKAYLERKAMKLNEMRQELHRVIDPKMKELSSSVFEGKYEDEQDVGKIASGGRFAVQGQDGLILSTHDSWEEALASASAKRYARAVDLGPEFEYRKRGPLRKQLPINRLADSIRNKEVRQAGDALRYGTAGTGGTGTGSGL
jgi:hypothetical protein